MYGMTTVHIAGTQRIAMWLCDCVTAMSHNAGIVESRNESCDPEMNVLPQCPSVKNVDLELLDLASTTKCAYRLFGGANTHVIRS